MILCSVVMGAGTAMGGKKIIKSVGMDMVKLEKYQGFSADIASSLSLVFCSVFGLPVSTTHVKATSIMGVGAVKRVSAIAFAKKLVRACELLCELMGEFENFKKSKKIRSLIVALNDVEEECDRLYLTSVRALTQNTADVWAVVSWCKIFESLEACADACEHVSECVGSVIMKNT